jgi:hypothetical protein
MSRTSPTTNRAAQRGRGGLTLVEMALALLALGVALTLATPWIALRVKGGKVAAGKEAVAMARDHVIGWAMLQPAGAKRLPPRTASGLPLDPWGRPLVYVPDDGAVGAAQDLTSGNLCASSLSGTDLGARLPGPVAVANLAFVVASRGPRSVAGAGAGGADYDSEGNPLDLSDRRVDDLVEFVTLDQLRAYVCTN